MHNAIILGSGRSGTSLVAGLLSQSGYYMGDHLYPPHPRSNAKGFFECKEINDLNEDLLATVVPPRWRISGQRFPRTRPVRNQRWLARLAAHQVPQATENSAARIQRLVNREPFCLKDPRFSYTLPVWQPWLRNTKFICVFRHPAQTAASILRECATRPYLRGLKMSSPLALETWRCIYESILTRAEGSHWLFLHYRQALQADGQNRLANFLQTSVYAGFPDAELETQSDFAPAPARYESLYANLCRRAGYTP